jgi:cellulose synthase/poly-beta-1,6-N-acetylglucosamine synthase-like glycosyltransferase
MILTVLLLLPGLLCGLFLLVIAGECWAALLRRGAGPRSDARAPVVAPGTAILVPAHNEEAVLASALASLLPQLAPGDRLLVIADNCSDDTAGLARRMGVEVIERRDLTRQGKSFALDYGMRFLAEQAARPEVVVVMDADTQAAPEAVRQLAQSAVRGDRPVQGTYLLRNAPDDPRPRLAEFAFTVRNFYRPAGLQRLGLPCLLNGTGMAFPWHILAGVDLANGSIVEDRWLTVDLALEGHFVEFSPALVTGTFPATAAAAGTQRERWEHGHLHTMLTRGPRLLAAALRRGSIPLFALALELCVPPLSLLAAASVAVLGVGFAWGWLAGEWIPFSCVAAPAACAAAALFATWRDAGRPALGSAPGFLRAKLPVYLRFVAGRQTRWIATDRKGGR